MKLHELFEDDVEEGLARWAGIAGLGAAALMGQPSQPSPGTTDSRAPASITQVALARPVIHVSKPSVAKPAPVQSSVGTASNADPSQQQFVKNYAEKIGRLHGNELAAFLAQTAHETGGFRNLEELGDDDYFQGKYDIRGNPARAAALGNVNVGDGARYKGRGFIHLTGRENYRRAGEALHLPLEQHPEMASRPSVAAKIALWFWKNRVKPNVSNWKDIRSVTHHINPAMQGLPDRAANFQHYIKTLAPAKKK